MSVPPTDHTFEQYQRKAAALREQAIRLRDIVKATYFKRALAEALRDLDELDSFLLNRARKADTQQHRQLWLMGADVRLQFARSRIDMVQKAVDTYVAEVARLVGTTERTIRHDIASGRLRSRKLANGRRWISAADARAYRYSYTLRREGHIKPEAFARVLGVGLRTVRRWIASGVLRPITVSARRQFIANGEVVRVFGVSLADLEGPLFTLQIRDQNPETRAHALANLLKADWPPMKKGAKQGPQGAKRYRKESSRTKGSSRPR
jgi:hypothetical protein